jgi:hypothetical protein
MKKFIIASSIVLILILLSGIVYAETTNVVNGVTVKYLYEQSIKMLFEGDSMNWTGSYAVEEIIDESGNVDTSIKVVLDPKKDKITRWINYEITTSNGVIKGSEWLIFSESLVYEADEPLPNKDDKIEVKIKQGDLTEIFYLECTSYEELTPTGAEDITVTAQRAVELLMEVYFNIYGVEMPSTYTVYVEYLDGEWVVSYDDNDGIGGKAYLTIDAKTAETSDIKVEEGDIKVQE